jgi:hypothetical protein
VRSAAWVLLVLGACSGAACKPDTRAAACASDRATLQAFIEDDKKNDAIAREADSAMAKGQGKQAAEAITRRARPQAESLAKRGASFKASTRWGLEQHAQVQGLLEARVRALGDYADALTSDDLARVLDQLRAQRDLEQRAIDIDRKLAEPQALELCGPP